MKILNFLATATEDEFPFAYEDEHTEATSSFFQDALDLSFFKELLDWKVLLFLAVSLVILFIAKFINQLLAGYRLNKELTSNDNKAVALSFSGFLLAICIIIYGVLFAENFEIQALKTDLTNTAIWSAIGCSMLLVSRIINDKLILPKFSNKRELIQDRNIGVGLVQAGSYISTALIIKATISSPGTTTLANEIMLSLIWFVATQALLILFAKLYQFITKFDMHEELRNDNPAVGVALFGNLVGFSILLSFFIETFDSLLGLFIWALLAAFALFLVRVIVDKLILPNHSLDNEISKDRNWGAAAVEAATIIGTSMIIAGVFH